MGAEIHGELDRIAGKAILVGAETVFAHMSKQLNLGVAKHIDVLHGVADEKIPAGFTRIPGGEESGDQFVLTTRGVLELVDKEMANVAGGALGRILQDLKSGDGDLGEVDGIGFGKDDAELGDGAAEDGEDVAEGGP